MKPCASRRLLIEMIAEALSCLAVTTTTLLWKGGVFVTVLFRKRSGGSEGKSRGQDHLFVDDRPEIHSGSVSLALHYQLTCMNTCPVFPLAKPAHSDTAASL